MMRKINRNWRDSVGEQTESYADQCMNHAAAMGRKVRLGELSCSKIRHYYNNGFFDVLMRADYTWKYDVINDDVINNDVINDDNGKLLFSNARRYYRAVLASKQKIYDYHHDLHTRYGVQKETWGIFGPCFFMEELLACIISKCETRNHTFTAAIVFFNSTRLVEKAHELKFPFGDDVFNAAECPEVVEKLCYLGYSWNDSVIKTLIDKIKRNDNDHGNMANTYRLMIEMIANHGYQFTDNDLAYAIQTDTKAVIFDMWNLGYVIQEDVIARVSTTAPQSAVEYARTFVGK